MPTSESNHPVPRGHYIDDDTIDFGELFRRMSRGLPKTIGLAFVGLVVGAVSFFAGGPVLDAESSTRVVFSFKGYERGEYPDKSKFQPDDLRAPEVIAEALKRRGLEDTLALQGRVRAALSIEGIIPASITKENDRLRAAGQTPRVYMPDEYKLTLSLPRKHDLAIRERELLLNEIVSVYLDRFQRTYVQLPLDFGNAFQSLEGADYFDYELILSRESQNIAAFLEEMADTAKSFRSQRTNLSFSDLYKQNQVFTQIRLNETLGLIRQNGLSMDRRTATLKMDYYLRSLEDQELKASEEEKLVNHLLQQAQERAQSHVLGVKSQVGQQRTEAPLIDQGLIDSLLANDAYNFLVRKALDAGLKTRGIQSEKAILLERRQIMQNFVDSTDIEQSTSIAQFEKSLGELKAAYAKLFENIRMTHEDYQRQQFGDAIRISMQVQTESFYRGLAKAGVVGLIIGAALGIGLSLLGVGLGRPEAA